jgi:hypothetical protein
MKKHDFDIIIGCSVGSLLGTFIVSKCSLLEIKKKVIELTNSITSKPFFIFDCFNIIKEFLKEHLPKDAYQLCSHKLHIQTLHYTGKVVCFHSFSSNDDLIDKIMKACHVPFLGKSITNEGYMDRLLDIGKEDCCHSCYTEKITNNKVFNIFSIPNEEFIESQFHNGYYNI